MRTRAPGLAAYKQASAWPRPNNPVRVRALLVWVEEDEEQASKREKEKPRQLFGGIWWEVEFSFAASPSQSVTSLLDRAPGV